MGSGPQLDYALVLRVETETYKYIFLSHVETKCPKLLLFRIQISDLQAQNHDVLVLADRLFILTLSHDAVV